MKKICMFLLSVTVCLAPVFFSGCTNTVDLTNYVSEYRSEIFIGTEGEYSVFANYTEREYPYTADGNVGNITKIFEIALTVPDNTKTYSIEYSLGGKEYTHELSFDSVRLIHTCSQTIPLPTEKTIEFKITSPDDKESYTTVTAQSVKQADALSLSALLQKVRESESERFNSLISGNTFCGELYVRLIYDNERCFYYVGIIDNAGKTYSVLTDAVTGEIIATRGE